MSRDRSETPGLGRLREQVFGVESIEIAQARRLRLLPAIERAMLEAREHTHRARSWRHRARVATCGAVMVAIGAAMFFVAWPYVGAKNHAELRVVAGSASVRHRGRETIMRAGTSASTTVDDGDGVGTSPNGSVSLLLASRASVVLGPRGKLSLDLASPDSEVVRLEGGGVDVHVPKLGPSRRLAVRTSDALVTVHGTVFSVSIGGPLGAGTGVVVTEGLVSVRCAGEPEVFVGPGESHACSASPAPASPSWTAVPAPLPPPGNDERTAAAPRPPSAARERKGQDGSPPRRDEAPANASSLTEQNRLFGEAMGARRAGNDRRAIPILQLFLDTFPSSPLVQEVRVEQFRALARAGDHGGASRAAARYLMEFHDGFARDEARRLVMGAPSGAQDE